jgi:hypothetical protein
MAAVLHSLHAINRYMQTLVSGGWSISGADLANCELAISFQVAIHSIKIRV